MDTIYTQLKKYGKVKTQVPFAKLTSFKIGGPAAYVVSVETIEALVQILDFVREEGVPYMLLGGGSNMLASDEGFDGVVIRLHCLAFSVQDQFLIADAGCSTVMIAQESIKAGLTGFEWGVGVPGTIGGAVRGNAGAMGKEMKDDVSSVEIYRDGEILTLSNDACSFGYRDSIFKHNSDVVLRVTLTLKTADTNAAGQGMKQALEHLAYRNKTQPKGSASIGCIFKNPDFREHRDKILAKYSETEGPIAQFARVGKISAGWLVQESGMKGKAVGKAMVSHEHGNFIVNTGGATAQEVQTLIEAIKEEVYNRFEIALEEEIYIMAS